MRNKHIYRPIIEWTGNKGSGTFDYRSYSRSHTINIDGKPEILGSSDSSFRGEKHKHNPEDLFVSALSGCHMLWYLHLCADNGVIVLKYRDLAEGTMVLEADGSGYFEQVILRPEILIAPDSSEKIAFDLHKDVHHMCFLANSCKFPIIAEPSITKSERI